MNDVDQRDSRPTPRYVAIETALSKAIAEGRLAPGMVLTEDPIARLFGTSRTPVRKALSGLLEQGALVRFEGRGFLVGSESEVEPIREVLTAKMLGLDCEAPAGQPLQSAERIAQHFGASIADALPFGKFRINELAAAEHYRVSRTVIRELLQRHQDRGLVRKDRRSHWVVGPLTARDIAHYFSIRGRLEPLALEESAPLTPRDLVQEMLSDTHDALADANDLTSERVEKVERDIHWRLLQRTRNPHLLRFIEQSQIALVVNNVFSNAVGGRPFTLALREHLIVLEFILRRSYAAAAVALGEHLRLSAERTQKRLMAISVFPLPMLPDYLTPERRFTD